MGPFLLVLSKRLKSKLVVLGLLVMDKCCGNKGQKAVEGQSEGVTNSQKEAAALFVRNSKNQKNEKGHGRISMSRSSEERHLIESHFKCVLCCNLLTQPVSLPCGHMFCAKCLSGYKDPAQSSLKCPNCYVTHQMTTSSHPGKGATAVACTTPVHAVAEFLKQLNLNCSSQYMSGVPRNLTACLKHHNVKDWLSADSSDCGNINWKVNFNRCQSTSDVDDDRLPFVYETRLSTDVTEWKNGYPVEGPVCLAEGLRWALAVIPSRGDDNDERRANREKPTSFALAVLCKGWADKTCKRPLSKPIKLSVWVTINNVNDCSLSYNSGARLCKFDHLVDPRRRSAVVVSKVMQMNKLTNHSEGWLQQNSLNLVCKFKMPKKMIKLNVQVPRSVPSTAAQAPSTSSPITIAESS